MVRHSGTWAHKYSAQQVLAAGKALMEPFHRLSTQDFTDHARQTYDIDYRHALDWLNAARKFGDNPGLLEGLTEAVIRRLAAPRLSMEIAEQIIADIREGHIDSNYRVVEQAIAHAKGRTKKKQEAVSLGEEPVEPADKSDMAAMRSFSERWIAIVEQRLAELQTKRKELQQVLDALSEEEQQLQAIYEKYEKRMRAYDLLLSAQ
jgi:vacuolar-type H+-ATPase subunit I/STV1